MHVDMITKQFAFSLTYVQSIYPVYMCTNDNPVLLDLLYSDIPPVKVMFTAILHMYVAHQSINESMTYYFVEWDVKLY